MPPHTQEFAWLDNGDATVTFVTSSYHAGSQTLTSGLNIDGTAFLFTSLTAISDAGFTALLGTMDGVQVVEDSTDVNGYGSFTASLVDLGWAAGTFSFTASAIASGAEYTDVNGTGTTYTNTVTVAPSAVPLPASSALLGAGLAAMGFAARRRRVRSQDQTMPCSGP